MEEEKVISPVLRRLIEEIRQEREEGEEAVPQAYNRMHARFMKPTPGSRHNRHHNRHNRS